mgnify:CR=1 FL=1
MAKTCLINKAAQKPKYCTRKINRSGPCGRPRELYRKIGIRRDCFRRLAARGEIPGVRKASW